MGDPDVELTDEPTESDLLEELVAALDMQHIQPGDVTMAMLAERIGCDRTTIEDRMKPLLETGRYTKHYVMSKRGRWQWVYRRAEYHGQYQ